MKVKEVLEWIEPKPIEPPNRVKIVDFDMPFWHIVSIMVKVSIASIPALVILGIIGIFVAGVVMAIFQTP